MVNETRAELLAQLSAYASDDLVARASLLSTEKQIRDMIAGAKEQLAYYRDAGFEDMSLGPEGGSQ